jgi:hypothetical protein
MTKFIMKRKHDGALWLKHYAKVDLPFAFAHRFTRAQIVDIQLAFKREHGSNAYFKQRITLIPVEEV